MRCFISSGHGPKSGGGYDSGADPPGPDDEHVLCDEIARAMAMAMRTLEPHVVPRGALADKIAYVNRWSRPGDVALEIHLNAGPPTAHGCESFYYSQAAKPFAAEVHAALVKLGRAPRGVKPDSQSSRKQLSWCRLTKPWAALVEVAFITNPEEHAWLQHGGTALAGAALAKGVDAWFVSQPSLLAPPELS